MTRGSQISALSYVAQALTEYEACYDEAMTSSAGALGQVIRDLRRDKGLTQEALGVAAGYKPGAGLGVTVSRIENGLLEPSPDRLEGIAAALGMTSTDLLALADARGASEAERSRDGVKTFEQRIAAIQEVNERRKALASEHRKYTDAGTAAEEAFLTPFRAVVARMDGIEVDVALHDEVDSDGSDDTKTEASYQLRLTTYGVKGALASASKLGAAGGTSFDSFAESVALSAVAVGAAASTAGTKAAINSLGTAVTVASSLRAAPSAGWLGIAGGLVAGGLIAALTASASKRTKKQQTALDESLATVEKQIAESQPGLDALLEALPHATRTLNYIAVHAGHALHRWKVASDLERIDWRGLSPLDRSRYEAFADIAAAQLAVQTLNIRALVESRGNELERTKSLIDEVLIQAEERVTQQV